MTLDKYQIEALLKLIDANATSYVFTENREEYVQLAGKLKDSLTKLTV